MAMGLLILGAKARCDHIWPEIPDDPHHVRKNFVVIPDVQRFISRLRKAKIERSREELLRMVDPSCIKQFFCSNHPEPLAQFGPKYVLTSVAARNGKISGIIKRPVRPERHQVRV